MQWARAEVAQRRQVLRRCISLISVPAKGWVILRVIDHLRIALNFGQHTCGGYRRAGHIGLDFHDHRGWLPIIGEIIE